MAFKTPPPTTKMTPEDPPPPAPPPKDEKAVSATSSTTAIDAEAGVLPLRPTLLDRYNNLAHRLFPQPYYFHPLLTRERLFASLLALLSLILLLAIILPSVLTHKSRHNTTTLPLPSHAKLYTGDGTYYNTGLGSCGITSNDSEMVVAIGWQLYDGMAAGTAAQWNPNANPACGRKIWARRVGRDGAGIVVKVVDRCTGCKATDLDFSPAAFKGIAEEWEGRVGVEWTWL
ncbi:RlpA-like double-psi beta-barrel-protein domain-containing protein-containing protein [Sphaerosporella brunnea]|uniref:RlpA-like double-psi beta-barrel-protein domain-containing protein-containing protein n=1 Tax=Sphaerosporella brunnea TaxID=1250544 RepID=A0A5J5F5L2_9PEZI|nr:RlpA-like double-psi beta-barrel-protein domain-containing protein-containing protein [Sphaerosporella brunnea]